VSYETAAHRFTNLATRRLDIPVHFMRIASTGVIYKAYENDDVHFPTDATGAIEGQRVCRYWTARAVFDRPDVVDRTPAGLFSVSVGVSYTQVKWMRGRETRERSTSRCPDPPVVHCRPRTWPSVRTDWRGPAPGCIHTCWPPCRLECFLASTTPKC
jgi:hypothetical protein